MRADRALVVAAASLILSACGYDLESFGGSPEDFVDLVQATVEDPDAVRQSALDGLSASDPTARFGAVYALTVTAEGQESIDALVSLLGSDRLEERLLAADALVSRGDRRGIPPLIEALASDEVIPRLDPPQAAWQLARTALLQHTEEDFGLSDAEKPSAVAATQDAWEEWYREAEGSLRWDPATRRFVS
jgi:hypothetical protein